MKYSKKIKTKLHELNKYFDIKINQNQKMQLLLFLFMTILQKI